MPATFRPSTRTSFGCLIDAPAPIAPATASAATSVSSGQRATGGGGLQDDGQARPARLVDPDPSEPAAARGLVLGERDGAVRGVGLGASSASKASRSAWWYGRPKPPRSRGRTISGARRTRTRVGPPCNPASPQRRPIRRETLGPTAARLREALGSDPRDARERRRRRRWRRSASGTRRGSRSSRCTCCATPRTRATPRRTRSRSSSCGSASSAASRSSRPGCTGSSSTPARTSRRPAPRAAPSRCRGRARRRATATRSRALAAAETRRELGRCLAELPPAQATVVALKDAFDLGFAEISAATGLPVGTAKCYAHRGRAAPARTAVAHEPSLGRPRSRRSSRTAIRSCSSTR